MAAAPNAVSAAELSCPDLFRLSTCRHRWESNTVGTCTARSLTRRHVRRCLEAAPGAPPARIVFIGDSRVRNIFERTLHRLGLPMLRRGSESPLAGPALYGGRNLTAAPAECLEPSTLALRFEGDREPRMLLFCSHRGGGGRLRLDYWWRVFLSRAFRRRVDELAAECGRRPARCPLLVVLGDGLWYVRRYALTESTSAADWAARYRRDLAELLPALRRLSAATRVVWKLDEPQFRQETGAGKPGLVMPGLGVVHALVYTMTAGVTNLTVWSSMVSDSVYFFRSVCWRRRQEPGFERAPLNAECSDMHHVGATVLDRHVSQLLNWLCQGREELGPGHCCRAGRRTA